MGALGRRVAGQVPAGRSLATAEGPGTWRPARGGNG
jgi:hypothetical protein